MTAGSLPADSGVRAMKLAIRLLGSVSALYLLGGAAQAQPPTHAVEYLPDSRLDPGEPRAGGTGFVFHEHERQG
jgi:hypothetical protein